MRILVIGGLGNMGKEIVNELKDRHELIIASRMGGDIDVDIEDENSIVEMYKKLPKLDAVAIATGGRNGHIGSLTEMSVDHYRVGLDSKLLGQVNVVLKGIAHLNQGGSFTLISGAWASQDVIKGLSNISMVNAALEGFVKAAAIELPNYLRINAVSPTVITESMAAYGSFFRGFSPVPASDVALAFSKSIEGQQTGQIYKLGHAVVS